MDHDDRCVDRPAMWWDVSNRDTSSLAIERQTRAVRHFEQSRRALNGPDTRLAYLNEKHPWWGVS